MSTAAAAVDVDALVLEAFPRAILRRLKVVGYAKLADSEQAAARDWAAAYEAPRSTAALPAKPELRACEPITADDAARNRAALEAELIRIERRRREITRGY